MASHMPAASAERHALNSKRFHALLLASASIVWWTNAAGEFVEEQPYWQAYTGQTWDEYRGSRWTSCLHPDDRDSIVRDWAKAVTSGGPYFTQGRIWNVRYGAYRAFQMRGIPIRNERDEIVEWLGALTDVQDTIDIKSLLRDARKDLAETLQALRISEARSRTQAEQLRALSDELRATLNTAGIGIARCSRDLRYLNANETYATITGFPLSEIIGRPIVEVMGEAAFATILPYIERVLTGVRVEYETVIPYHKGVPNSFFRVVNVPDRDPKGSVIGWIACVADITASRQAELALAERNAQLALAERNAQLALVGRAALVGCYAFDVNKGEMQISEGYAVIHGLPEGTTETTRREWRDRLHPEDIGRLDGLRSQNFSDRRGEYNVEYRIVLPNRGVRWIESRSFISYDGDGNAQRVVGVDIDVTGRKRAEERQRELVAELDHRVKNVLASVSAVISHSWQESTSVNGFAAALDGRIRSMATTHELLSIGRWQGISLTELVRRELAPYAMRHNTEIIGPEVVLRAEAGQAMAMVLHELTTNAAKYGALSTKQGRVLIRWDQRLNGHARSDLVLIWKEIGGPPVASRSKPGYGTSTIRDLIPYEFGGTVDHVLASDGVHCHLQLPADWLINDGETVSRATTHANDRQEIKALKLR
jgi:PAS domain S-box-containing protein